MQYVEEVTANGHTVQYNTTNLYSAMVAENGREGTTEAEAGF